MFFSISHDEFSNTALGLVRDDYNFRECKDKDCLVNNEELIIKLFKERNLRLTDEILKLLNAHDQRVHEIARSNFTKDEQHHFSRVVFDFVKYSERKADIQAITNEIKDTIQNHQEYQKLSFYEICKKGKGCVGNGCDDALNNVVYSPL